MKLHIQSQDNNLLTQCRGTEKWRGSGFLVQNVEAIATDPEGMRGSNTVAVALLEDTNSSVAATFQRLFSLLPQRGEVLTYPFFCLSRVADT